jgi:predicted enzyme related to lactoylglutathione lyase
MITNVTHISILVTDQDTALAFYTNILGFETHTDAMFGPERWLTVCSKGNRDFELALIKVDAKHAGMPSKELGKPMFCVATSDCRADYKRMKDAGVVFLQEPKDEPWGIGATFQDPFGNIIYMSQAK